MACRPPVAAHEMGGSGCRALAVVRLAGCWPQKKKSMITTGSDRPLMQLLLLSLQACAVSRIISRQIYHPERRGDRS